MSGRKGQLTIFIIMGIIILAGVGLYSVVRRERIEGELIEAESALEEVPIEFASAELFIKKCVQETSEEGVRLLGEKGGFISPSRYGINDAQEPTEGDAAKKFPNSDYVIPYWYYMKSPNNCIGKCSFVEVPGSRLYLYKKEGTPSIEGQLEDYINENLDICLDDFKVLKEQGFKAEKLGEISTRASVKDNEVLVLVDYPLEFSKIGKKRLSKFFIRIPVNLKGIYELSKEIVGLQRDYRYLEAYLKNLIAGYSSVSSDRLPPMHETLIRYGSGTTWPVEQIKERIEMILASYIQTLQVSNTANYEPYYTPNRLRDALYNAGMLIPVHGSYTNLEAGLRYYPDWWPIYFEIDCEGGTCRPESFSSNLVSLIGIQRYSFAYDVSFPVEVEIKDPYAFNNKGYSFFFLIEANLRDNEPMNADYLPAPSIPPELSEDLDFCNAGKRVSDDITINVFDSDNYEISGADVIYTCIEESCSLGKTEDGILTAKFPSCLGGVVSVLKDGYLGQSRAFDVEKGTKDESGMLRFNLNPIMLRNFVVKKKMIEKKRIGNSGSSYGWFKTSRIEELKPNEKAFVLLEKESSADSLGFESFEEEFRAGGEYNGAQEEPSQLRIGAGSFKVSIRLLLDEKITIPPTKIGEETIEWESPEPHISGGLSADYTFTNYQLQNSDTIIFYALSPNLYELPEGERRIEDVAYSADIEGYSKLYRYGAWPKFE